MDEEQIDETEFLDCVQITPEHIRANGTVHSTVFTGLAEIIDNALDSQAREVRIQYCQVSRNDNPCGNYITVADNGNGMSRIEALNTIMIGYSTKRGNIDSIGQFGNGLKSGSMRLGETLLLCTKQLHQYTVLLISLKYLDKIHSQKCFVPCISYEWKGVEQWEKIRLLNEDEKKHDKALKIILDYSPFRTEDELKAHLQTIKEAKGTIVLVTDLKRLENSDYEMALSGVDLVVNEHQGPKEVQKVRKKKGNEEEETQRYTFFSEFLSQLYLHPMVAIYINDRKVNMRDPIRVLADPRWAYLDKGGFHGFLEREKQTIEEETKKKSAVVQEKTAQVEEIAAKISRINADNTPDPATEYKRLKRAQRMAQEEVMKCKESLVAIAQRKLQRMSKASTEIKVHLGMDLMRRCDPRVVFYTNGRRIIMLPLNKKGAKFKKVMGVVCIIDIPSTLLPTSQNRENYATPAELNQLMGKIQKIAELYLEHAPNKYKSDAFWIDLGYKEKALAFDSASHNALEKVVRLTGLRRLCANCLQFRKVKITNVDVQTKTLDELNEPFECNSKQVARGDDEIFACDAKGCVQKTEAEVQEETIKELRTTGRHTIYGESKAQDKTDASSKKGNEKSAELPVHRKSGDIRPSSRNTRAARSPSLEETPPPRSTGTSTHASSSRAAPVERSSSPENTPSSRNGAQASTRKRSLISLPQPPPGYIEDALGGKNKDSTADAHQQLISDLEGYSRDRLSGMLASARMETETMTEVLHTLSRMLVGTSGEANKKLVDELSTLHTSDNPQKLLTAIVNKRRK